MNSLRHKLLVIMATAAVSAFAAPRTTVLNVRDTITDNNIMFPASFEANTREMMKNWYLQNYATLDADVENYDPATVSDEEYIKRLKAMPTIIEMPFNQIVRSYIERYVKRNRTQVEQMLGMSLYYMPIFEQALEKEGLPLELKYLPVIESGLDPTAVSHAGAAGLWQFMVGTGKGLGLEVNSLVDERRDPYRSSTKAATYLKNLYNIYSDWSLAIAAYNCGPGAVNKALRRAGGEKKDFWEIYEYLPRETRGYVPAFIAANYVMTYFKRHNISPSLAKKPLIVDSITINKRVNFNQISKVLNMPLDEIRALNPQFRQDVIPGTDERSYSLVLPATQVFCYIMSEDSIMDYRTDLYAQRGVVEPSSASGDSKSNVQFHKVRRGETAESIATKYGMTAESLLALNDTRKIKTGQVLKVQQPTEVDTDGIRVIHSDDTNAGDLAQNTVSSEDEDNQIAEVKLIEKEAASNKARQTAAKTQQTETSPKAPPKVTERPKEQTRARNEKYTAQPAAETNKEQSYKNSKSSSNRGDAKVRNDQKAKQDAERKRLAEKKAAEKKAAEKKAAAKKAAEKASKPSEHLIKSGESLSTIAEKTGVSVSELRKANGLSGDNIRAGATLKIPAKKAAASKSKKNDTAGKTSKKKKK